MIFPSQYILWDRRIYNSVQNKPAIPQETYSTAFVNKDICFQSQYIPFQYQSVRDQETLLRIIHDAFPILNVLSLICVLYIYISPRTQKRKVHPWQNKCQELGGSHFSKGPLMNFTITKRFDFCIERFLHTFLLELWGNIACVLPSFRNQALVRRRTNEYWTSSLHLSATQLFTFRYDPVWSYVNLTRHFKICSNIVISTLRRVMFTEVFKF